LPEITTNRRQSGPANARQRPGYSRLVSFIPPSIRSQRSSPAHQDITDRLIFEIDGQFSRRKATSAFAFLTTSGYQFSGNYGRRKTQSYSVAPHLRLRLDGGWQAQLSGVIGSSDAGALVSSYSQGPRNHSKSKFPISTILRTAEIGADGPLFSLPAGEVQLAVGAGYRGNTLNTNIRSTRGAITTTPTSYVSQQDVVFGYGELSLPLVGENNQLPLIRLLKLTAALRYEDYAHVGGTATPKIGLRYSPVRDLDISATWGRSFKAPTLAQARPNAHRRSLAGGFLRARGAWWRARAVSGRCDSRPRPGARDQLEHDDNVQTELH
jgi:outer membrane receptor protein involved in Fe transport